MISTVFCSAKHQRNKHRLRPISQRLSHSNSCRLQRQFGHYILVMTLHEASKMSRSACARSSVSEIKFCRVQRAGTNTRTSDRREVLVHARCANILPAAAVYTMRVIFSPASARNVRLESRQILHRCPCTHPRFAASAELRIPNTETT